MSLEPTIADITARLRQGKFPNQEPISAGMSKTWIALTAELCCGNDAVIAAP